MHAVVFMLGGVCTRWEQVVAYHLTGNSFSAKAMKQVILDTITECEKIGIHLHVVVTDMGRQPSCLEVIQNCGWETEQAENLMCSTM